MFDNQIWITKIIIYIFFLAIVQACIIFLFKNRKTTDLIMCNINNLHDEKINEQGIFVAILYCIFGIVFPNNNLGIIIISIIFEIVQPYFGNKSNYVLGPLVNFSSYTLGSILGNQRIFQLNNLKEKYEVIDEKKI